MDNEDLAVKNYDQTKSILILDSHGPQEKDIT